MIVDDLAQPAPGRVLKISPTDVSQFIRLEQCQRYLRLRLHEAAAGRNFMRRAGLTPQAIPPCSPAPVPHSKIRWSGRLQPDFLPTSSRLLQARLSVGPTMVR
jgi:hypothetical protein